VHQDASSSRIMRRLTTLFPSEFLKEHAEELGVVERNRKTQMPALVWSFVFGFATSESRTLAGFWRSYNATADNTLSPGGFHQRLTPTFAEYLCDLVELASRLSTIDSSRIDSMFCSVTNSARVASGTFLSSSILIVNRTSIVVCMGCLVAWTPEATPSSGESVATEL